MMSPIGNRRGKTGKAGRAGKTGLFFPISRISPHSRFSRGLTLIEVLVAVTILVASAVGVLQALGMVAHALAVGESRLSAYEFAVSKMGELKLAAFQIRATDEDPLEPLNGLGSFRVGSQPFRWEVTSQTVSADPGLGSMTLTVEWNRGSQAYENRFSTLFRIPVEGEK